MSRVVRTSLLITAAVTAWSLVLLTNQPGVSASTPRGLIAYERSVRDGPSVIWLMNSDGSNQHALTRGCCFDWAPDGQRVAFFADGIYVINVDGTGRRRLLAPSAFDASGCFGGRLARTGCEELGVDWSPDGRKVVVGAGRGVFVASVDGSNTARLTSAKDSLPSWSPDGRVIVFQRFVDRGLSDSGNDLFRVSSAGADVRRLTYDSRRGGVFDPRATSWSPDGHRVAYDGIGRDIFVMSADGTMKQNLTRGAGSADQIRPIWSPDGKKIVFQIYATYGSIHTIRPDGSGERNLTRGQLGGHEDPHWSADSQHIVFSRASKYQWDVYVMTADGNGLVNLTNTPRPTFDRAPSWSP